MDEVDLDIDALLGWKLSLRLNRKKYQTCPPSLADLALAAQMAPAAGAKPDAAGAMALAEPMIKLARSLLVDPPPSLSLMQASAVVIAVIDYYSAVSLKNFGPALAQQIRLARAAATPPAAATAAPTPADSSGGCTGK